jgi:hypothetical protein
MSNEMIVSPYGIPLSNDIFTFSDERVSVVDGKIVVDGVDGGFEDEFNSLDSGTWDSLNTSISNGALVFDNAGGDGYNAHYVQSVQSNFSGLTIEIDIKVTGNGELFSVSNTANGEPVYGFYWADFTKTLDGYLSTWQGEHIFSDLSAGDTFTIGIKRFIDDAAFDKIELYYKLSDGIKNVIAAGRRPGYTDKIRINNYYATATPNILEFRAYGYPTTATATLNTDEALKADPSTKLKNITSFTIGTTGSETNPIALSTQKKDSRLEEWSNFDDDIGESDTISSDIKAGGTFTAPSEQNPAPDREILPTLTFSGDGVTGFNTIDSIDVAWEADVAAPTAPTATEISQDGEGGVILAIDGLMPADAYGAEIEVNINGVGYLPISKRGQLETGQGYLIFRGNTGEEQKADELNSMYWPITGLTIGDTVQIRARYLDAVGNRSAFTESSNVTISGTTYVKIPVENYRVKWSSDSYNARWQ